MHLRQTIHSGTRLKLLLWWISLHPSQRIELRDITATLLTEVSNNVGIEPVLQKLSDEHLTQKTSISSDDACLDIVAENFWGHNRQKTYFDVRVFNPFCATLSKVPLPQCYRRAELEKKRAYEQRIREIEFGSFSPLVFSTTGGLGSTATVVFKRLASLIADKQPYSKTLFWLRCKVSFSLLIGQLSCASVVRALLTTGHNISSKHQLTLQFQTARPIFQLCKTLST